jgi:hypothetical protein
MADSEEYELVPVTPMRRLEKRMERIESSTPIDARGIMADVIEIVRMNQMLVDELAKANDALRIELSRLPGKLDEVITQLKELISFIKASGEEEAVGVTQEAMKPVVDKLDEVVKTNKELSEKNDSLLELLDQIGKRLRGPVKRPMPMKQLLGRPMVRPKPRTTQPLKTTKPINI